MRLNLYTRPLTFGLPITCISNKDILIEWCCVAPHYMRANKRLWYKDASHRRACLYTGSVWVGHIIRVQSDSCSCDRALDLVVDAHSCDASRALAITSSYSIYARILLVICGVRARDKWCKQVGRGAYLEPTQRKRIRTHIINIYAMCASTQGRCCFPLTRAHKWRDIAMNEDLWVNTRLNWCFNK